MEKQFMIVELPKEADLGGSLVAGDAYEMFESYEHAFDAFNERIGREGAQIFAIPKGTPPLRVALENCDLELWIINRTNDLTISD